jgi:hypothetical protein
VTAVNDCFGIRTDNVTIDCAGYSITGSRAGFGINASGRRNITVRDCTIQNFTRAINLNNTNQQQVREPHNQQESRSARGSICQVIALQQHLQLFMDRQQRLIQRRHLPEQFSRMADTRRQIQQQQCLSRPVYLWWRYRRSLSFELPQHIRVWIINNSNISFMRVQDEA